MSESLLPDEALPGAPIPGSAELTSPDGSGRGPLVLHRALITVIGLATLATVAVTIPDLHLLPADLERRFTNGPMLLGYAVYAAVIAQIVGWKVVHRPEARSLSVVLATLGVCIALSVVPTGHSSVWRRIAFGAGWAVCHLASFRFWLVFPHRMTTAEVEELRLHDRGAAGWVAKTNRGAAWVVQAVMTTSWAKAWVAVSLVSFILFLVGPNSHTYSIMGSSVSPSATPIRTTLSILATSVMLAVVAFAWTSFRLADGEMRKKAMWIIFAHVITAVLSASSTTLALLHSLTNSEVLGALQVVLATAYLPLVLFVLLTGYSASIFYAGAFDLRPVISKTTLYGAMIIVLTFVFAIVEEAVEALVAQRLDIPDGMGAWIGAGVLAIVMGPVRTKLETYVKALGQTLEG